MRFIKNLFLTVLALLVLILIGGLFVPNGYKVSRTLEINASASEIHAYVGDLKRWEEWTEWSTEHFPDMQATYNEATTGAGASYTWADPGKTKGKITLLESDPAKGIKFKLEFEGYDESIGTISYHESAGKTDVVWDFEGKVSTPVVGGYISKLMDLLIGENLENGLTDLKAKVEVEEAEPAPAPST